MVDPEHTIIKADPGWCVVYVYEKRIHQLEVVAWDVKCYPVQDRRGRKSISYDVSPITMFGSFGGFYEEESHWALKTPNGKCVERYGGSKFIDMEDLTRNWNRWIVKVEEAKKRKKEANAKKKEEKVKKKATVVHLASPE